MKIKLLLLLNVMIFISCSFKEKNFSEINIWHQMHYENRKVLREVCDKYEEKNPDIKINLTYRETEELRSNFQSASMGGSGPELIYGPSDQVGPFAIMGIIHPLDTLFERSFKIKKHTFKLRNKEKIKLNFLLKRDKIDLNSQELIKYILKSIELREFSKFIFSKSIDQIFKLIAKIVPKKLSNKEIISFFSISEILNNKINQKLFLKRKKEYENNLKIFLPEVITNNSAYDVIPYMFNIPNFITSKRVSGKMLNLNDRIKNSLENKIVLIENADPGFDWIFTKKIKN